MRTRMKNVLSAVDTGNYETSNEMLSKAFAAIDKNVKRGIVHRNNAARKKSQLHMKVKALEGPWEQQQPKQSTPMPQEVVSAEPVTPRADV